MKLTTFALAAFDLAGCICFKPRNEMSTMAPMTAFMAFSEYFELPALKIFFYRFLNNGKITYWEYGFWQ